MFLEPLGELGFGELARGEGHHHRVGFLFVSDNLPPVLLEKNIHQDEGDSLVAINKRMILADMKAVSGSLVKEGFVNELATDSHLWLSKRRVEEARISQSGASSIPLQQIRVNGGDNPVGNESSGHYFPRA
jgi:hypothetical protein